MSAVENSKKASRLRLIRLQLYFDLFIFMEEYLDILTKSGKPTGEKHLKSKVHKKGYYHNIAHVWFYTDDGEILQQQRSATKVIYPLLWDVSVSGHVDAGETVVQAALRETKEEIGLSISANDLYKIGVFECFQTYPNGIIDNEFHHTFISEFTGSLGDLAPQDNEVEALKLIKIIDFFEKLELSDSNNHFIASNRLYYETVIDAILQKIT